MDLSQFNSRANADEARPLHLRHPATGELLMDGEEPSLVFVLGNEGRIAQSVAREVNKLEPLGDDATKEDVHGRLCATASQLITGFSGLYRNGRPLTKDDIEWFLWLNMSDPFERGGLSFAQQVLSFSGSRANYLGKSGAALSEPPSKSAGKTQRPTNGQKREAKS